MYFLFHVLSVELLIFVTHYATPSPNILQKQNKKVLWKDYT